MCAFGVLGLSCETLATPKPAEFHDREREKKNENGSGRGIKREILGGPEEERSRGTRRHVIQRRARVTLSLTPAFAVVTAEHTAASVQVLGYAFGFCLLQNMDMDMDMD